MGRGSARPSRQYLGRTPDSPPMSRRCSTPGKSRSRAAWAAGRMPPAPAGRQPTATGPPESGRWGGQQRGRAKAGTESTAQVASTCFLPAKPPQRLSNGRPEVSPRPLDHVPAAACWINGRAARSQQLAGPHLPPSLWLEPLAVFCAVFSHKV